MQLDAATVAAIDVIQEKDKLIEELTRVAQQLAAMGRHYEFCATVRFPARECWSDGNIPKFNLKEGVCDCGWAPAFQAWARLVEQRRLGA
jgi:hypothetical protein